MSDAPLPPLTDWRDPWQRGRRGIVLGVLAFQGELDDDYEADYDGLAAEAVRLTGAVDAFAAYVDPGVGASGYGIGLVLEFMDVAADVVALGTAALALAPKLKRWIESLRSRPDVIDVCLLPEALEVLVVAEVCRRNGLGPADLTAVSRRDHHPEGIPERRIELQQMSSCSVVTVVASVEGIETLWTYVVTSEGRVVADSRVDLPTPGAAYWTDDVRARRRLDGL